PGSVDWQVLLNVITVKLKDTWLANNHHNASFQTDDLDTYDSDCDDISSAKAVLMANLLNYSLDILSEVPNFEIYQNDMDNQSVQAMHHFEQTPVDNSLDNRITRIEERASWDLGTGSHGVLGEVDGTVQVDAEISSGSTTTHSDISISEYDSFIFDFTHEEFVDELAHIISPPQYDCFYFWNFPDQGELMYVLNFKIRENLSTTSVNLPIEDDHSPLLAYVVWIFLAYLMYPVIPPYLHPFRNKNTIFDPGITINHFYSFKPGLSHRYGAFKKFNTHRSHLNEWPMIINEKNTPILDVLLFHFYPP
nr:hypothetical protein [Tanacetum cinerariifolium]